MDLSNTQENTLASFLVTNARWGCQLYVKHLHDDDLESLLVFNINGDQSHAFFNSAEEADGEIRGYENDRLVFVIRPVKRKGWQVTNQVGFSGDAVIVASVTEAAYKSTLQGFRSLCDTVCKATRTANLLETTKECHG